MKKLKRILKGHWNGILFSVSKLITRLKKEIEEHWLGIVYAIAMLGAIYISETRN